MQNVERQYHGNAAKRARLLRIICTMVVFTAATTDVAGSAQPVEIRLVKRGVGGRCSQRRYLVERFRANVARHGALLVPGRSSGQTMAGWQWQATKRRPTARRSVCGDVQMNKIVAEVTGASIDAETCVAFYEQPGDGMLASNLTSGLAVTTAYLGRAGR